ncbi:MAG TPA: DUF2269 family protein [Burkholderiaceae bacterium]
MHDVAKFLHVAAAVFWLGGIGFLLFVLRPVAMAQLQPATRLPMMTAVLRRFFVLVWLSVVTLALTGAYGMAAAGRPHPAGWHAMAAIGMLMFLLFGHVYFSPFRKLKAAVAAADWPAGARAIEQIVRFARVIFALGWLAIGAVLALR